jgi:dihydrofolate reductase
VSLAIRPADLHSSGLPALHGLAKPATEGVLMRKIVADLFVSLDGVVESPEQWTGPYFTDDLGQLIGSEIAQAGTMLLGRVTYQTFAASFANQVGGMADQMNAIPKIVVSATLEAADWQNSTLVASPSELADYKRQPGRNIAISGSAGLVRSLLAQGLLDELRLLLFPVVIGSGQRLFDKDTERLPLTLLDSRTFSSGVVRLTYQPQR